TLSTEFVGKMGNAARPPRSGLIVMSFSVIIANLADRPTTVAAIISSMRRRHNARGEGQSALGARCELGLLPGQCDALSRRVLTAYLRGHAWHSPRATAPDRATRPPCEIERRRKGRSGHPLPGHRQRSLSRGASAI